MTCLSTGGRAVFDVVSLLLLGESTSCTQLGRSSLEPPPPPLALRLPPTFSAGGFLVRFAILAATIGHWSEQYSIRACRVSQRVPWGEVQTISRISDCAQAETIFLDLHLLSLDLITKVSKALRKGDIVIADIHVSQHPQIVPDFIPVNQDLVREAISTDHGLTEELPGISRLGSSVGSLVSIILRLEVQPRLAVQKGADNAPSLQVLA
jgi:hypothetical protein